MIEGGKERGCVCVREKGVERERERAREGGRVSERWKERKGE